MNLKEFFKLNKKLLIIIFSIWLIILLICGGYKITNASVVCYDSTQIDEVTGELKPVGGCETQYVEVIVLSIIWVIILMATLFILKRFKK